MKAGPLAAWIAVGVISLQSGTLQIAHSAQCESPFQQRGYYITFMRMPTYDLADWRGIVDGIQRDNGNTLLLWIGGGFRSARFPVTWQYNKDHANIQHDFVRELIDYAHTRGIKVLLAFTPFGYDGVNQFPLEHPELRAIAKDGKPVEKFGIHCWGYNLCPSQPASQQFMLDYAREMFFDFYPNADGLMIESSDYAICHCEQCRGKFFEREFAFVKQISAEVWAKKPEATVVVYPHYFSGSQVPGLDARAAREKFDPRWTLFFTPHSAHLDAELIRQAKASLWSDDKPALHLPEDIRAGAQRAKAAGITGYIPSLEAFSFTPYEAEEGQPWLQGKRQIPLGFGWLPPGDAPYDALPMRVNRIAYREFTCNSDLSMEEFKTRLGREVFGDRSTSTSVDDLLALQAIFFTDRTWCMGAPLAMPERIDMQYRQLPPEKRRHYARQLESAEQIEKKYRDARGNGELQMHDITKWLVDQWTPARRKLLDVEN